MGQLAKCIRLVNIQMILSSNFLFPEDMPKDKIQIDIDNQENDVVCVGAILKRTALRPLHNINI